MISGELLFPNWHEPMSWLFADIIVSLQFVKRVLQSLYKMSYRRALLMILLAVHSVLLNAAILTDSLKTQYSKGTFHTYCEVLTLADMQTADAVVNDFISQFRGDPELLFEWALKGVGKQEDDEKDAVLLVLKSTVYDPQTSVGTIKTDIVVPGLTTFKDVDIESKVTKEQLNDGSIRVIVDVYYSNSLLKKAYGTYHICPNGSEKVILKIHTYIRFGWFFDLFITQRRYRNLAEFRVDKFMDNMRKESERRYQIQKKQKNDK